MQPQESQHALKTYLLYQKIIMLLDFDIVTSKVIYRNM